MYWLFLRKSAVQEKYLFVHIYFIYLFNFLHFFYRSKGEGSYIKVHLTLDKKV